jgi:RNA polymerase sigma factor (TIGR02999 family)
MSDVTRILSQIESGDPSAAEQLLPLVYDELRKLAAAKLAREKPGQTLQATSLVHDAYLRLVDVEKAQHWDSRGHFFAAAAEAMRRILVDNAYRKKSLKRGGNRKRLDLDDIDPAIQPEDDDLLALDEALSRLAEVEPRTAELVKLRYFAGFTNKQAAELLGISPRQADSVCGPMPGCGCTTASSVTNPWNRGLRGFGTIFWEFSAHFEPLSSIG